MPCPSLSSRWDEFRWTRWVVPCRPLILLHWFMEVVRVLPSWGSSSHGHIREILYAPLGPLVQTLLFSALPHGPLTFSILMIKIACGHFQQNPTPTLSIVVTTSIFCLEDPLTSTITLDSLFSSTPDLDPQVALHISNALFHSSGPTR